MHVREKAYHVLISVYDPFVRLASPRRLLGYPAVAVSPPDKPRTFHSDPKFMENLQMFPFNVAINV